MMITLPANCSAGWLRREGKRYGSWIANRAEQATRKAHELGVLTEAMSDQIVAVALGDLGKTTQELAAHVSPEQCEIFERAVIDAYREHMAELAGAE